jgi:hypothetical protein
MHDELVSNTIVATSVNLGPSTMVVKVAKWPPSVERTLKDWEGASARP